ncbi:MAG TPA: S8 family serine peptidase [Thermoanaerobaculia bacterium]|jgi:subtilisin family serine protease|nr:S8 family serine peptidase [Thermoanaerobaculia bacterium]
MSNGDETSVDGEETGRYLIFFHPEALPDTARMARNAAGIAMTATAEDAELATASEEWRETDTVVVPALGVAIASAEPEQVSRLQGAGAPIRHVRKEYIFQIANPDFVSVSTDYLRGYQAGVNALAAEILGRTQQEVEAEVLDAASFRDNADFTWGLQATGVDRGRLTGSGVRVAVLDTGFDMQHPDFLTRGIVSQSFITGVEPAPTPQDDNGHGTHCLGTLGGPRMPGQAPRYGIATDSQLFVGKVMKSNGKGREGDILHGIGWALQNNCRIVSLSLGKPVARGESPDTDYEEIGAVALRKNCLLIAAAGNDSDRPGSIEPVALPANSRTILAVGAINRRLELYPRSNGGLNLDGGGIDLVGPGVEVRSSKRLPIRYGNDTGTSMATPHVAGIAALLMEADPGATAEQIWTRLTQTAKRLPLPSSDVGSGLVQVV